MHSCYTPPPPFLHALILAKRLLHARVREERKEGRAGKGAAFGAAGLFWGPLPDGPSVAALLRLAGSAAEHYSSHRIITPFGSGRVSGGHRVLLLPLLRMQPGRG